MLGAAVLPDTDLHACRCSTEGSDDTGTISWSEVDTDVPEVW